MSEPRSDPFLGLADRMDTDRDRELVRIAVLNAGLAAPPPLDLLTVERFGDAVMAALRLRLVHGATDALYTPREVAEMARHVIEKQLAALRAEGETSD